MCPVPPGTLPLDPVRRPLDSMGRLMPLRLGPSGKQNPAVFLDQTTCPVPGLVQSPAVQSHHYEPVLFDLGPWTRRNVSRPTDFSPRSFSDTSRQCCQRRKPARWDHFWHSLLYQCTESRPAGTTFSQSRPAGTTFSQSRPAGSTFSQSRPAGSTFHGPAGTTCPTVPGRWLGVRATCPGRRGTNASSPAAGDLFPLLVKTDPHHRRGSNFRPRRDSIPTGQISAPPRRRARQPPHEVKRTDNRQRDSPARTATVPLRAARRLSPACRKNRPVPTPSFYDRVNNFETFSGRRGPACRLFGDGETTILRAQTRPPAFSPNVNC
jgi:hypothetical protein